MEKTPNRMPIGSFYNELLRSIARTEIDRRAWLQTMLDTVRVATNAAYVYLGETGPEGAARYLLIGNRLHRTQAERFQGLARKVVAEGAAKVENTLGKGSPFRKTTDGWKEIKTAGYAAVPIPRRHKDQAWLFAGRTSEGPEFGQETLEYLSAAAEAIAVALDTEARFQLLETEATTDALTHIPNYRFLKSALAREIDRAGRIDEVFTVVMVDVDNLKQYNAVHGHLAGSELLQSAAHLLRTAIRRSDIVAKYGGDEFLIILPRTEPEGGRILSERIRKRIDEGLRGRGGEKLSCSFGVASFPRDGYDFESLLASADEALYGAKEAGRNRVVAIDESEVRRGLSELSSMDPDPGPNPMRRKADHAA